MRLSKVRFGQRVAAIGAIVLLVSMFLDWYGFVGIDEFGADAFEHPGFLGGIADALLILACVVAIGGALLSAMSRSLGLPVALSAITTFGGGMAALLVLARMVFQPGPNDVVTLEAWIFVGLFGAAAIVYGGWIGMRDDTPENQAGARHAFATGGDHLDADPTQAAQPVAPIHQAPATDQPTVASTPAVRGYSQPQTSQTVSDTQQGAKMETGKVKPAELVAGIGGAVLLLSVLFFDWFSVEGLDEFAAAFGGSASFGAWDGQGFFGTIANLLIIACAGGAIAAAVMSMTGSKASLPVPASTAVAGLGGVAVVLVVLRMLFQPGPNEAISLEWGIYLAFLGAVAVAVGGFLNMKEEGASFDQARDQLRATTQGGPPGQQPPAPQPPPSTQPPQTSEPPPPPA